MPFDQLEKIIDFYRNEILEMGKWIFAVEYLPMTKKQKDECLLRAKYSAWYIFICSFFKKSNIDFPVKIFSDRKYLKKYFWIENNILIDSVVALL